MHALTRMLQLGAALLAAALLAACGDGDGATGTPTATAPPTSTVPESLDYALWPDPADADPKDGPSAVARSFVEDFIGVKDAALTRFEQGDSRSGEISLFRRGEDGRPGERVITMIALRQLDGPEWFVIAAFSDEVVVTTPSTPLAEISSPVNIAGRGVGHEGNVILRVHAAFDPEPLAQKPVIAGAGELEPFSAALAFERPAARTGVIVARAGQPLEGSDAFAAFPVRFAAG